MPDDMPQFGFELEFENNAQALATVLASTTAIEGEDTIIGDSALHSYHCECGICETHPFRMQRDSSCSGELISNIFTSIHDIRPYLHEIQEACFTADAEPGLTAGLHVHVDKGRGASQQSQHEHARRFWQWVRFEPAFIRIAFGRFDRLREFNQSTRSQFANFLTYAYGFDEARRIVRHEHDWVAALHELLTSMDEEDRDITLLDLYAFSQDWDRHGNLATRTRHNTWEFRIWNSTRVAWRMELFIQLSRLWMCDDFIDRISELPTPREIVTLDYVRRYLLPLMPEDVAGLFDRQLAASEAVSSGDYQRRLTL